MDEIIKISSLSIGYIAKQFNLSRTFVYQWTIRERPIPEKYKKKLYNMLRDNLNETLIRAQEGLYKLNMISEESVADRIYGDKKPTTRKKNKY